MKKTLQILCLTLGLFLNQTTFAAAHFESLLINELKITPQKEKIKSKQKNWQKPNYRIKKEKGKHGFGGIISIILGLTALLVVLKLTKLIAWSWIWVVSPIWITIALVILIIIYVIILFLLMPPPPKVLETPLEEMDNSH